MCWLWVLSASLGWNCLPRMSFPGWFKLGVTRRCVRFRAEAQHQFPVVCSEGGCRASERGGSQALPATDSGLPPLPPEPVQVRPWVLLTGRVSCGFKTRGGDTDVLPVCPCSFTSFLPSFLSTTWLASGNSRLE